ncbi:polysaccharide lyase family 7 protein [Pseudonocardia cypriaca]|uniref:Poly(Beta-D-mannuronate) lyase n=1 Tax=Pseudonocardia cypriaca TaxID=882449 RepID=A0A543GIH1_9PSEU|nr:polysaccharide lyase family 7 protein [Pseudonocardia cypriaca]TQM45856.1 poly(beta-D-mannuronate) lyase [Pseudonocardia cypriaca]
MALSHALLTTVLAAALSTGGVSGMSRGAAPPPLPPPVADIGVPLPPLPAPPLPDLPVLPEVIAEPPGQEAPIGAGKAEFPADLLDLSNWKLTLPTGAAGSPEEVLAGKLSKFTNEFFKVNESRDGVVFMAEVGGVTTKNSHYPRSELREMQGDEKAAWSNPGGTHTLEVREAILAVPKVKPEVVAAQIHDGNDDVLQIRLEGERLSVQSDDGQSETVIDPAYRLGTPYDLKIVAADGRVDVFYNGEKKAELTKSGTGWYFKVGAYVQSSPEKGDAEGTPGAVAVYALKVTHTD